MLAVGRASMTNPCLNLMTEPSEGLAPLIISEIESIIGQLRGDRISIFLVGQKLPMALRVSDYVSIISKGKIVYESTPHELEINEDNKAKYLSAAR